MQKADIVQKGSVAVHHRGPPCSHLRRSSAPNHPERPEQSAESHSECEMKVKIFDGDMLSKNSANVGKNGSTSRVNT